MNRKIAIAAIVAGAALVLFALMHRTSDEDRVKARLDTLAQVVHFDADDNLLLRGARIQRAFADLFVPDVVVRAADLPGSSQGRDGLVALATKPPVPLETAQLDFEHVVVSVDAAHHTARAQADAVVTSTDSAGAHRDRRQAVFRFVDQDGSWRIAAMDVAADEDLPPEARP